MKKTARASIKATRTKALRDGAARARPGGNPATRPGAKALPDEPRPDRVVYWHVILIACLAFAVFAATLHAGFVWDDKMQVVRNQALKDLHSFPRFFTTGVWGLLYSHIVANYYRPIMYVLYSVIFHLFGLHAGGFHLASVVLHVLDTVLVYLVTLRLFRSSRMALIAGLIFAVHPVHTEAVAWIAAVPELIFTFFYLLAFYFYLKAEEARGSAWLWRMASLLLFFVSLLSKEMAFTLPLLLIVYEYLYLKKRFADGMRRVAWYFIPAGVCLAMRFHALKGFAPMHKFTEMSPYEFVLSVVALVGQYWWKLVAPVRLNAFYVFEPSRSVLDPQVWLALAAEAGLGWAMWRLWRSGNTQWFSIAWVFLTLIPVLYINGVGLNAFTERYLYLPSMGFCWLIAYLLPRIRRKGLATALAVVLTALFSARTVARAEVWNNEFDLDSNAVEESPSSFLMHNQLGVALVEKGRIAEARDEFLTTLRLAPDNGDAHQNLADLYVDSRNFDEAVAEYRLALGVKPEDPVLRTHLGYALFLKGETDSAIVQLNEGLRIQPEYYDAYKYLGMAHYRRGATEEAIRCFRKCKAIRPSCEASGNLGSLYAHRGLLDDAVREFQEAERIDPGCVEAYYNLGTAYSLKGQFDQAIEQFREVLSLRPGDADAQAGLEAALERKTR
jgi:tetratricopeptide (TPR) repeat protein